MSSAEVGAARRLLKSIGENEGVDATYVVVLGRPSLASGSACRYGDASSILVDALPGARFLTALRRGNVHGALDMGLAPGILPGRVSQSAGREWFTQAWGSLPGPRHGHHQDAQRGVGGAPGGLILLGADPLSDFPDRVLAKKGLQGAGLVVAVDCFLTESAKLADVILPAATYGERPGSFTNLEGRVLRLGQKVTAPGVAWPDWMIASELAYRLGNDLGFDHLNGIWDEIERLSSTHAGVTSSLLASIVAKDGVVVPVAGEGEGPRRPPPPIDPMAEPGIIASEAAWLSGLDAPEGTSVAGATPGPEPGEDAPRPGRPATLPVAPAGDAAARPPDRRLLPAPGRISQAVGRGHRGPALVPPGGAGGSRPACGPTPTTSPAWATTAAAGCGRCRPAGPSSWRSTPIPACPEGRWRWPSTPPETVPPT